MPTTLSDATAFRCLHSKKLKQADDTLPACETSNLYLRQPNGLAAHAPNQALSLSRAGSVNGAASQEMVAARPAAALSFLLSLPLPKLLALAVALLARGAAAAPPLHIGQRVPPGMPLRPLALRPRAPSGCAAAWPRGGPEGGVGVFKPLRPVPHSSAFRSFGAAAPVPAVLTPSRPPPEPARPAGSAAGPHSPASMGVQEGGIHKSGSKAPTAGPTALQERKRRPCRPGYVGPANKVPLPADAVTRADQHRHRAAYLIFELSELQRAFPQRWQAALQAAAKLRRADPHAARHIQSARRTFYRSLPQDAFCIARLPLWGEAGADSPRRFMGRSFLANPNPAAPDAHQQGRHAYRAIMRLWRQGIGRD